MPVHLKSRLLAIAASLPVRCDLGAHLAAETIARDARANAPVGDPAEDPHPGRLRDSIHVERRDDGWYVLASAQADLAATEGAPYGHMVEFGTVDTAAQPFMVPAAEANRHETVVLIAGSLRNL